VIFLVVPPKDGFAFKCFLWSYGQLKWGLFKKWCIDFVEYRWHFKFLEPYICPCCLQACEKFNLLQNFKINILKWSDTMVTKPNKYVANLICFFQQCKKMKFHFWIWIFLSLGQFIKMKKITCSTIFFLNTIGKVLHHDDIGLMWSILACPCDFYKGYQFVCKFTLEKLFIWFYNPRLL
jgi:hypothetical protein